MSGTAAGNATAIVVAPDQLVWRDNPTIPGSKVAVLVGDPSRAELVVMRVKLPANARHLPHWHPFAEVATLISGRVGFAVGEMFDPSKGTVSSAGALAVVPARQPHYIWTEDEDAVVQVQFVGPFGITYANPADDPRSM